ncbi:hypothetical protein KDH_29080 [Dictyobacter sp. S3.2.2.5]|uniref:CopC domain-containing protein n=1 Tax=Dictyobacter halimunensis TaxID=3026934 RepID=A0ABQ6FP60_9CHLR|nr:hypothetical protein KDH_29080 [Dictyobacter sp. S3.2.2.5]
MRVVSLQRLRLLSATILSLGLFFAFAGTALAQPLHAKVISSDPAINSVIAQAPTTITVTTAENMKPGPANSNVQVYGPDGALVNNGDAKVSLNNPTKMSVTIKPEKTNGTYVVRWTTVSAEDGDPDQGAFVFSVGSTSTGASTQTQPTPAPKPTAPTSTTASASSTPLWISIVTGIVALVVGLGAGMGITRMRKPHVP